MNWIVWTLLSFVLFVLLILAGLSYLRIVRKPHSAKMAEVQERANKKVRMSSGQSATAPETRGNGGGGFLDRLKESGFGVSTKMFWSLMLIVMGGVLWYMIPNTPVHPTDIGNWGRGHWLQILIIWGIAAALIALNTVSLRTVLQGVLAGVVFMLVIGFPIWAWISGGPTSATASSIPQESARAIPRDAPELPWAWNKDGTPTDISKWPMVKVPPGGDSVHVPIIPGGHVVWAGSGFTIHCVYADGDEGIVGDEDNPCADGNIVESYVRNEGETELYVSYAYARQFEK